LGTGGGLPGIPLKIIFPKLNVTLLDATQKKIIADKEIVTKLKLKGINAISGRAEELRLLPEMKENYDYVISRGVGKLEDIFKWGIPFLTKNHSREKIGILATGAILSLKGGDISEEIQRVKTNKKLSSLDVIEINFKRSDSLLNPDKKIVIMYNKNSKETI
jgi:16S rRNA (guanine527-N7)-methyltransferase